jgi:holo-[acyl-carrier protein] synthase
MSASGAFFWSQVVPPDGTADGVVRAGVDRVELDEFQRTVEIAGDEFLERIFTTAEIAFCAGRVNRLATRFAAKEAVAKVLGTGFRGLGWREVEVVTSPHGEPHVLLHDRARDHARRLGMRSIGLSMTHTTATAEAFVVALCRESGSEQSTRKEADHGCDKACSHE